ncbi:hypothetical protein D5S18_24960 [Nocardia panacis]|uniref:Uncharacterized protein n=1 Tax=Nocardia panacis TaxID=2340916 RepID=A0A3A4KEB4_9NOCA|nr:hypothetical protein D5S18_24960 [Nocardia panacis]
MTTSYEPSRFRARGWKRARFELRTRYGGAPGYISPEPVRAHILELTALGLPMASIARDAGCTEVCVRSVVEAKWATIRIRQAAAIMAVDFRPTERQGNVLAVGAVRRLRALQAIGWTWPAVAEHTPGISTGAIRQMTRPGHERILIAWQTWATIRDAYERLSGTPGTAGRTRLVRNAARTKLWAPPLDWEDHDIDDPRVSVKPSGQPTGTGLRERAAERRRQVAQLTALGRTADEIADRLGISQRQVVRHRSTTREGMPDA